MRRPCCRWRSHGRQRQTGGHQDRESEIKQSPQIHGLIIPRDGELWKPATFTCSPVTAKSLGTVKLTKALEDNGRMSFPVNSLSGRGIGARTQLLPFLGVLTPGRAEVLCPCITGSFGPIAD
jgi:hypothetical protein